MKILITGGAGFVGARLARTLLARGTLDGQTLQRVVLADQAAAPAELQVDARVEARVGRLLDQCAALRDEPFDGVFHLASAVSGECEADFDLGLRSNLDSTRALLDALRCAAPRRAWHSDAAGVLQFGGCVSVPDDAVPIACSVVTDETLAGTANQSYGTHKLICEHLVADYTRKGYIDGRAARLMTVTVRPGQAQWRGQLILQRHHPRAVGRLSVEAILPGGPWSVAHPVSSPQRTVQGLDQRVYEATPRGVQRPHGVEPAGAECHGGSRCCEALRRRCRCLKVRCAA